MKKIVDELNDFIGKLKRPTAKVVERVQPVMGEVELHPFAVTRNAGADHDYRLVANSPMVYDTNFGMVGETGRKTFNHPQYGESTAFQRHRPLLDSEGNQVYDFTNRPIRVVEGFVTPGKYNDDAFGDDVWDQVMESTRRGVERMRDVGTPDGGWDSDLLNPIKVIPKSGKIETINQPINNNNMDINTLLRNVIASGAASIPVSLVSGQGLGQTAINALATGAGAGIGTPIAGSYGALGGAISGNVLANLMGTDRNERNYDDLSNYGVVANADRDGMMAILDSQNTSVGQLLEMLPKSKQEAALAMLQNNMGTADQARSQIMNAIPEVDEESMRRADAIIRNIIASQPQAVVVQ